MVCYNVDQMDFSSAVVKDDDLAPWEPGQSKTSHYGSR